MSIATTIVWEVRTAGSDNNGGGFKTGASGTDWTQQSAAQYALTGVTSSGAGNVLLSASAVADMIGNLAHVISGTNFTAGWYEITSVSAGVSITLSTNNSGGSAASGVGAAGVVNIGGAIASPVTALAQVAANNTVWIKNDGTYTMTTTAVVASNNNAANASVQALIVSGYTTTRGDLGRPLWTTATNSNLLIQLQNNGVSFQNINFSNTATTRADCIQWANNANDYNFLFLNLKFDGFNVAINPNAVGNVGVHGCWLFNCEIKNSVSHGLSLQSGNQADRWFLYGCYIHDNGGNGIFIPNALTTCTHSLYHCIIANNTLNGLRNDDIGDSSGMNFINIFACDFVNNTLDGIFQSVTATQPLQLINCIFYLNGGWGVNLTTRAGINNIAQTNAYGSNTSGARQNYPAGIGDVALTADPFTAKSSGDYSLNNTAGGGASCRAAGWPGVLTAGGTGFADIGALQSTAATATPINVVVVDTLVFSDAVTVISPQIGLTFSDTITLSDAMSILMKGLLSFAETLTLNDVLSLVVGIPEIFNDTITLADAIVTQLTANIQETLADTIVLSDVVNVNVIGVLKQLVSDGYTLSDAVAVANRAKFNVTVFDILVLVDSLLMRVDVKELLSDTITLSDAIAVARSFSGATFSDTLSLNDSVAIQLTTVISLTFSDTLTFSDSVATNTPSSDDSYLRRYLNDVIR